ncbi:MAG: DUF6499 domain-containing protein [Candidatus Thiodiazotropha sp.]
MSDCKDTDRYAFTRTLSADQWAWEFLRRNPLYRQEWQRFIVTWRDLEACYGKPSQRDMNAWKQDSRAWVPAASCSESDCRVDGDKVLIECALGARWGFYKFPPDPADDDPVGGNRLVWRPVAFDLPLLDGAQAAPDSARYAAPVFDLELPLAFQLEQAKRRLQIEQRKRVAVGQIKKPSIADHRDRLTLALRLLDAVDEGVAEQELPAVLGAPELEIRTSLEQALALRDRDYQQLLLLR